MRIIQLTPGAGGMYCGNCFRDNALVAELRRLGHDVLMLPLYLPMRLDEPDESRGAPLFYGGINVYLQQLSPVFGRLPRWLHRWLDSEAMLRFAGRRAAKTRASDVGALTLSMLRGEEGRQQRELAELVAWLKTQPRPDIICLSNAMLAGMARTLRRELGAPVAVMLQGEDAFLDQLPAAHRETAWKILAERVGELDVLMAPSRYYAEEMSRRLGLAPGRVEVVPNGIHLDGWTPADQPPAPPVLGYFARMCREKGLDRLVDAYLEIRRGGRLPQLKLHVGGGMGPSDEPLVAEQKHRLAAAGVAADATWRPNLTLAEKQAFYRGLSVLSVPAHYGEAFGLYLVEGMAAGVPAVQPRTAAYPELVGDAGTGVLCEPDSAAALAGAIEALLLDEPRRAALASAARQAAEERFNAAEMARQFAAALEAATVAAAEGGRLNRR
ncbi:MAG TPA: glycosyltransferase family 4 protein [Verrucomicrobiota bacterium]|nr:glycosyltransferase family 4 protein [Verrucomicrobiota bacterium]